MEADIKGTRCTMTILIMPSLQFRAFLIVYIYTELVLNALYSYWILTSGRKFVLLFIR